MKNVVNVVLLVLGLECFIYFVLVLMKVGLGGKYDDDLYWESWVDGVVYIENEFL